MSNEAVQHNGRTVTHLEFQDAYIEYCDKGVYTCDGGIIKFTWEAFVENAVRDDGPTSLHTGKRERDIWFEAFGWQTEEKKEN